MGLDLGRERGESHSLPLAHAAAEFLDDGSYLTANRHAQPELLAIGLKRIVRRMFSPGTVSRPGLFTPFGIDRLVLPRFQRTRGKLSPPARGRLLAVVSQRSL